MSRKAALQLREWLSLLPKHRQNLHTSPFVVSKIRLTDYQTENEDIERVFKIPTIKGFDVLRNPKLNKSTSFTMAERQILGIQGLLPPAVNSQKVQMDRFMDQIRQLPTDLQRYITLNQVLARNERLFYQLLMSYTEELMPIVYTPTVGKACREYGLIFRDPRGLFITINDLGHVYDIVTNWPERRVQAVVMTDGERTLGLGDLGCNGMGIPIGKLALYTACAGIHPSACLPITIDVGTNNETLLEDPMYIGLRQKRDNSERYDELIDEIIAALRQRFGSHLLIQFEDFAGHNSSRLLDKTRETTCSFNDDIQGTGAVGLAGVLASLRVSGTKLTDQTFLFFGAGIAACGVAHLIVKMLRKQGLSKHEASKRIWLFNREGLITKRNEEGLRPGQKLFAHDAKHIESFEQAVRELKPTVIFGVAGVAGTFTKEVCHQMALNCQRPAIFAWSNPTGHSDCTAEEAYTWTDGNCIFASGAHFESVKLPDGTMLEPAQAHNAYIFPGLALGVIATASEKITEEMFLVAAETLANQVSESDLKKGRVYPPMKDIQRVSFQIALSVAETAYRQNVANVMPQPDSLETLVSSMVYNPDYVSYIPKTYAYPEDHAELH